MSDEKIVGTVTIHGPAEMTDEGRKDVAKWLRKTAKQIEKEGPNMAKTFRARLFYTS